MTEPNQDHFELSVSRHINASPSQVWEVMTRRMAEWWCPKPWRAEIVEQEWRAGGPSKMIMKGPEGEEMPTDGIFLEVIPERRFVTTDAVSSDFKPAQPFMVGIWEIGPDGSGTRYTARALHWSEEAMKQHLEMGFQEGWSIASDQLASLCEQVVEDVR